MRKDLSKVYGSTLNKVIYTAMVIASENIKSRGSKKRAVAQALNDISMNIIKLRNLVEDYAKLSKTKPDRSQVRALAKGLENILVEIGKKAAESKSGRAIVVSDSLKRKVEGLKQESAEVFFSSQKRLMNLRKPQQIAKRTAKRRSRK